jgi:hypothetical protein
MKECRKTTKGRKKKVRTKYRGNSIYEISRNEQFVSRNIERTNKLNLQVHLANTEPRAYEYFNKLTLTNLTTKLTYKNKFNLRILNLQTHFKEHIMLLNWSSTVNE